MADQKKLPVINLDEDPANADWIRLIAAKRREREGLDENDNPIAPVST